MPMTTCLRCGDVIPRGPRCKPCSAQYERDRYAVRGSPEERGYDRRWRKLRAAKIAAHLAVFGSVCPGFARPEHPVQERQLTLDHVLPRIAGGLSVDSNTGILCLSCNSRKGSGERRGVGAVR